LVELAQAARDLMGLLLKMADVLLDFALNGLIQTLLGMYRHPLARRGNYGASSLAR